MKNGSEKLHVNIKALVTPRIDPSRSKPTYCKVCKAPTKERKDYCSEHIENFDYVDGLLKTILIREANLDRLSNDLIIDKECTLIQDALSFLRKFCPNHGRWTVGLLQRYMVIDAEQGVALVKSLLHHGLVTTKKGDRKKQVYVDLV